MATDYSLHGMSPIPHGRKYVTDDSTSSRMRRVRSRDTKPEIRVRSVLWRLGYRFTLHSDLPGCPDIALPRRQCVVFVHGCFWHRHRCPAGRSFPASNVTLWEQKFTRTKRRDVGRRRELRRAGWRVLVIWECEIDDTEWLASRLAEFIEEGKQAAVASRLARLEYRSQ